MDFLNEQIQAGQLPDAMQVNWQPVENDYLKLLRWQWVIFSILLLIISAGIIIFNKEFTKPSILFLIAGSWLFIILLYLFVQEKSFRRLAYAVREHDILYRRGWIIQKMTACPFSRIQHCSTGAGLLQRRYKLSTLTLFTAGAGGADLRISGLKEADAQKLREFIMRKIKTDEQNGN